MSAETDADGESADAADLRERVERFMMRNFPQIQMHGGSAAITDVDPEAGRVVVQLGGACSGCGISPMTVQALQSRLVREIPEVDEVIAETGMGTGAGPGSVDRDDVPF